MAEAEAKVAGATDESRELVGYETEGGVALLTLDDRTVMALNPQT